MKEDIMKEEYNMLELFKKLSEKQIRLNQK